ncbi:hypothetical protein ACFE04_015873 [Oxalis oulophora]
MMMNRSRLSHGRLQQHNNNNNNKVGLGVGGLLKGSIAKLSIGGVFVLVICTLPFLFPANITAPSQIDVQKLWKSADSGGWTPSSAPRSDWPAPLKETNGYLRVRCTGDLNQQRTAICDAVLAARILNATLVLPELDANSFWHDDTDSGFHGIYDVEHFIQALRYDVRIVESIPEIKKNGETKKIKAHQIRPLRDASISWYLENVLPKMKKHGAVYLTPFSHHLAEELDNAEYQRLRCRVNYHALRFKPHIMKLSESIVEKLQAQGHFMSIHLRFEKDVLAFAECLDIFTPAKKIVLQKYRKENFAEKKLVYKERSASGKCPLTPGEVGLVLRSMGFDNSARIYLVAGELFGGERYMKPFRSLFPRLENHSSVDSSEDLAANAQGLVGSAVDYMVCLLSDIFMPTYDGPSNFANNLLGHRLYYGFRKTIRLDRKALAPLDFGGPHKRISPESFYTNPWPECFCQTSPADPAHQCPAGNVLEILERQLKKEGG